MCIRDRCKRREDFITNIIMARIPTIHIPNSMYPAMGGVSLFIERVKSFIQFVFPVVTASAVPAILVPALEEGELLRLPSQEKICGRPVSYTHLDVYKRQGSGCSDAPPGRRYSFGNSN